MSNKTHIVCTSGRLCCEARRAWEKVCFYEHSGYQGQSFCTAASGVRPKSRAVSQAKRAAISRALPGTSA